MTASRIALVLLSVGAPAAAPAGKLTEWPVAFEANRGQTGAPVRFLARVPNQMIFIEDAGFTVRSEGVTVRMTFTASPGATAGAGSPTGEDPLRGRSNYFAGPDSRGWLTRIPQYRRVRAAEVYPGIDAVYYGNRGRVEYDLRVAAGADPSAIRLRFTAARSPSVDAGGDLLIPTEVGPFRQHRPVAYQETPAGRRAVDAAYRVLPGGDVAFELGAYDPGKELVIDPVITFSTVFGGAGVDEALAVATDAQGNIYLAGATDSADFPVSENAAQPSLGSGGLPGDAFVTKLSPDGRTVLYSTYLGGRDRDVARAIAVDAQGSVFVAGSTDSRQFPTSSGAYRTFNSSRLTFSDGFVTKLSPDGSSLIYSTYLGDDFQDQIHAIAVDAQGHAYVAGSSDSDLFPVSAGAAQQVCGGLGFGGFVTKLNPAGSGLLYSTRLCGSANDEALAIAVDAQGQAYVGGVTGSSDFPVTAGALRTAGGGAEDGFAVKLAADGRSVLWATYLGGLLGDAVQGIAVDTQGNVFAAGYTQSADFPVSAGAFQRLHGDGGLAQDGFVAKLNAAGSSLVFSTFLGGAGDDQAAAVAVGADGAARVTGFSDSNAFPTTGERCQTGDRRGRDAFVAKLSLDGAALDYSLYLGGGASDAGLSLALAPGDAVVVAGRSASADFTTTPDALHSAYRDGFRGASDAFVARVSGDPAPAAPCIALNGVVNGASFLPGPLAPGGIVSIFGAGLGPFEPVAADLSGGGDTFPAELAGTRVLIAGIAAPVIFTSSGQVSAAVPLAVAGRDTVSVRVEFQGDVTADLILPVSTSAPAVFTVNTSGQGQGAIRNQDFTVNSPGNPAERGSIVQIFLTGGGATQPAGIDGRLSPLDTLLHLNLPVKVTIGGLDAPVQFSGAAPGLIAGAVQINAQVPAQAASGSAVAVVIQIGDRVSPPGVTLAVK